MATYNIYGYVRSSSQKGLANLNVDLYNNEAAPMPLGLTKTTDSSGFFQFIIDSEILFGSFSGDVIIGFGISNEEGNVLLNPEESFVWTTDLQREVNINIDTTETVSVEIPLIKIEGSVSYYNGAFASQRIIRLYRKGFREEELLESKVIDDDGNYIIAIDPSIISSDVEKSGIYVEVYDQSDSILLATSPVVYKVTRDIELNIKIENTEDTLTSFDDTLTQINNQIAGEDITTITDEEIQYLAMSSGRTPNEISDVVAAHKLESETGITSSFFYAISKAGVRGELSDMFNKPKDDFINILNKAIDDKLISADTDVTAVTNDWEDYRATTILNDVPDETGFSFDDILTVTISDSNSRQDFMKQYLAHEGSPEEFWSNVAGYTEGEKTAIQNTIQCASISGGQPHMTQVFLTELNTRGSFEALAESSLEDWKSMIDAEYISTSGSCIPIIITNNFATQAERVEEYAKKVKQIFTKELPTRTFTGELKSDSLDVLELASNKADIETFLSNNPNFDFRKHPLIEVLAGNENGFDTSAIDANDDAVEELKTIQKLFNIAPDINVISVLKSNGLDSAHKIAAFSEDEFIAQYEDALTAALGDETQYLFKGNTTLGKSVHMTATRISNMASQLIVNTSNAQSLNTNASQGIQQQVVNADLRTLFGSLEMCNCESCQSIFSSSAYFVDSLNFLEKNSVITGGHTPYEELTRRRPDLLSIDLTCKNANTPLPYVDLVNEILENEILRRDVTVTDRPDSYQTSGDARIIAAYPEHIYRNNSDEYVEYDKIPLVYDKIKSAVYPFILPFNLPVEESRVYLNHMGIKREELYKQFTMLSPVGSNSSAKEYEYAIEYLNTTKDYADIITTTQSGSNLHPYYGFSSTSISVIDPANSGDTITGHWAVNIAGRVDLFLKQTKLSYIELLEMLSTKYINPGSTLSVVSTDPSHLDTCVLKDLEIENLYSISSPDWTFLQKIYRFIRLQKITNLTFYELDKLFTALSITSLDSTDFTRLAQAIKLCREFNIASDHLTTFWADMDTQFYVNYETDSRDSFPHAYAKLFLNKSVTNPLDPDFAKDPLSTLSGNLSDHISSLTAAYNIKEAELLLLLNDSTYVVPNDNLTLANLSALYRHTLLSKAVGLPVSEYLKALHIIGQDPFTGANIGEKIQSTYQFLDTLAVFMNSLFTIEEFKYLLNHEYNINSAIVLDEEKTTVVLEEIRNALFKTLTANEDDEIDSADLTELLENAVIQETTKQYKLDAQSIESLLKTHIPAAGAGTNAIDDFLETDVLDAGIETNITNFPALYNHMQLLYKINYITTKLKVSHEELEQSISGAATLSITDLSTLPVAYTSDAQYTKFANLLEIVEARDTIPFGDPGIFEIFETANSTDWLNALAERTNWEDLDIITGSGLLNAQYPADYKTGRLILRISNCIKSLSRLGIKASEIAEIVDYAIDSDGSLKVLKAAKAKHSEEAWYSIAQPLRNGLRERQRESLVAYLVNDPVLSDGQKWRTEDELFEYFLIDVEMKPCMMTSRIKQAVNSVQLFIQRVLLKLEYYEWDKGTTMSPKQPLSINPTSVIQWLQWRKIYRVWEANRKVFLYPENWIEPELRDDKTNLFKNLETYLLQNEVNKETIAEAMIDYLEDLEKVARLEVVSHYFMPYEGSKATSEKPADGILYLVARTYSLPHQYYWRKYEYGEWSSWEKVEAEINSDNVVPIIWHNRLFIFWLSFVQKGNRQKIKMPAPGNAMQEFDDNAEVRLNWTQFHKGKWTKQAVSEIYTTMSISNYNGYYNLDLLKESVYPYPIVDENTGMLRVQLISCPSQTSVLKAYGTAFTFDNPNSKPYFDWYWSTDFEMWGPGGIWFKGMKFMNSLRDANIMWAPGFVPAISLYYDNFRVVNNVPTKRVSSQAILKSNPYNHYVVTPLSNTNYDPLQWFFFYEDDKSTFFVERTFGPHIAIANPTQNTPTTIPTTWNGTFGSSTPVSTINGYTIQPATSGNAPYSYALNGSLNDGTQIVSGVNDVFYAKDNVQFSGNVQMSNSISLSSAPLNSSSSQPVVLSGSFSNTPVIAGTSTQSGVTTGTVTQSPNGGTFSWLHQPLASYFKFTSHYHIHVSDFIKKLNSKGIDGFLTLDMQSFNDGILFASRYQPVVTVVNSKYPQDVVDFEFGGAYSTYNWELFFHVPFMMAQRLSTNQQFAEAQKWYHYIFDPTCNRTTDPKPEMRFWQFKKFYDEAGGNITTIQELMEKINQHSKEVHIWEANPFKPHLIARMRVLSYMKCVIMKYIDNLIAWGDQLFSMDTIESINEATQLYILASKILGERPQYMPSRVDLPYKNYNEAKSSLDEFSNFRSNAELLIDPASVPSSVNPTPVQAGQPITITTLYFCIPKNDKLWGYWDTVADRLFKIRNCMNLAGAKRQLPLYEPPIDPGLLAKAVAAGVDLGTAVSNLLAGNLPNYKFNTMLQKANEFCNDVKSLGSSLLSALEKKDSEALSLIRSGHEIRVLENVVAIKESQINDAKVALEVLQKNRSNIEFRRDYYVDKKYMNSKEQEHLNTQKTAITLQKTETILKGVGAALSYIPNFKIGAPTSLGVTFGGDNVAKALDMASTAIGIASSMNSLKGAMAQTVGSYDRRMEDWRFQAESADKELAPLDKQIIAAQIKIAIAEKELENHKQQIENSKEADEYMRSKYTNGELYSWMIAQLSTVYFQAYQLAIQMAKKAEQCYNFELPEPDTSKTFIKPVYWDNLKKGLLSGEKLQHDLRLLETSYLDKNKRTLELSKDVSIALLNPGAILDLRADGECNFSLPEELFAFDHPGHYNRRIKSVSISIPCIAGPYTTIGATLTQTGNVIRREHNYSGGATYSGNTVIDAIATSTGQNDNGMFEMNFRDERYLPFEGLGAISNWSLKLMTDANLRQFNYDTISDVIVHIKYTALESGDTSFITDTKTRLNTLFSSGESTLDYGMALPRMFSIKHEFSNEWNKYKQGASSLDFSISENMFPYFCKGKTISLTATSFVKLKVNGGDQGSMDVSGLDASPMTLSYNATESSSYKSSITPVFSIDDTINLTVEQSSTPVALDDVIEDIYLVVYYKLS